MTATVLLKNSKYGIPITFLLSIIPQFYYYSLFGINLGSYITLAELPVLFIKDFMYVSIVIVIPYIIGLILFGDSIGKENTESYEEITKKSGKERAIFYLKDYAFLIIPTIISTILSYFKPYFILLAIVFSVLTISSILIKEAMVSNNVTLDAENTTAINTMQLLISVITVLVVVAYRHAEEVKTQSTASSITLITDRKVFFCKYTLRYIGRTKDYTFIYDQKRERTEIIKNSDITTEKKQVN